MTAARVDHPRIPKVHHAAAISRIAALSILGDRSLCGHHGRAAKTTRK